VNAATGATIVLLLTERGNGRPGVGGGGAFVAAEDSVVPPGPRGWDRRAPIMAL
jgi:hypothetical protein